MFDYLFYLLLYFPLKWQFFPQKWQFRNYLIYFFSPYVGVYDSHANVRNTFHFIISGLTFWALLFYSEAVFVIINFTSLCCSLIYFSVQFRFTASYLNLSTWTSCSFLLFPYWHDSQLSIFRFNGFFFLLKLPVVQHSHTLLFLYFWASGILRYTDSVSYNIVIVLLRRLVLCWGVTDLINTVSPILLTYNLIPRNFQVFVYSLYILCCSFFNFPFSILHQMSFLLILSNVYSMSMRLHVFIFQF